MYLIRAYLEKKSLMGLSCTKIIVATLPTTLGSGLGNAHGSFGEYVFLYL